MSRRRASGTFTAATRTTPAEAWDTRIMTSDEPGDAVPSRPPHVVALWLIVAGVIGWFAAFELTLEKIAKAADSSAAAGCDFSVLVQCSANLESWQGSVFGFPNPILGLTGWVAPIVVGFALLAGARFEKWFWQLFWLGMAGAMAFVIWLIAQSVFSLGTLCPWCMVTWSVTIPTFFVVTFHVMRIGAFGRSLISIGHKLMGWVPLFTVASYAVVALIAQLRLDFLSTL